MSRWRIVIAGLVPVLATLIAACGQAAQLPQPSFGGPSASTPGRSPSLVPTPTPASTPTSGPPTTAPAATVAFGDPCTLFEPEELAELTGHPFVASRSEPGLLGATACIWSFQSSVAEVTWDIVVEVKSPGGKDVFERSREFSQSGSPMPDLGVDNYPMLGNALVALKGDTMVTVQYVNTGSDANRQEVPLEVMRRLLAKLP